MASRKTVGKLLITGASGYLGRSLCEVLGEDHELLRMDVSASPGLGEMITGSVCDRELLDSTCARADALVLAHMAPNRSAAYVWPDACVDINVKGVALALEAAVRHGIKRVVLISSVSVVWSHVLEKTFLERDLTSCPVDLYGLTKVLQENTARFYSQAKGLEIAVLRPAYILREDSLVNKYGEASRNVTWQCIDPRDIARAVRGALQAENLRHEVFYLMAGPGAESYADIAFTQHRLKWIPEHRFSGIPVEIL
jgi:nucleoside-diphosphate-sugar epimerase